MSRGLMLLSCAAAAAGAGVNTNWLYAEVNGRGPSDWYKHSGDCSASEQSPIDIKGAQVDSMLEGLQMSYSAMEGFEMVNNQYSVTMKPTGAVGHVRDPNNKDLKYDLLQIHFHAPSEHGVSGGLFDMEMHLVHQLDQSQVNAATEKYQYLVVGVMFEAGNAPNEILSYFNMLPNVPKTAFGHYANPDTTIHPHTTTTSAAFDFKNLITSQSYYTYNGSFTTPPCTEGVRWYVMKDVVSVSHAQVDAFRSAMMFAEELQVAKNHGLVSNDYFIFGNNRPVQPLNGRNISIFAGTFPTKAERVAANLAAANVDEDDDEQMALSTGFIGIILASVALIMSGFLLYSSRSA